ncbi:MAG TPA: DUF2087 domain-containing protein [Acidimicrobiales bacterium]|nr:DUF2087 domain-containing protein [Acidimicrobiales bacterium]
MAQLAHRAPAPEELVGLLADPRRLRLVAALIDGPKTAAVLAGASGASAREAAEHLGRLVRAGLVVEVEGAFELVEEVFARSVQDAAANRVGPLNDRDTQIIRRYFFRNRLLQIPSEPWARKVVLDLIAEDFQPGEVYDEREVNTTLYAWNGDWAALRRLLVDGGYLVRDHGRYWRPEPAERDGEN